ncbi:hypothetical protein [Halobacillus sp. Marseille-P3879]|uniref:hypothetical protein n=1 Tax=Halobacillus sp. Marseille-P3879 TaxID=2045014 RepID=UPI000C7E730D|nr:hypothetical protein [Halobacillus sp. Marseille-P3879]
MRIFSVLILLLWPIVAGCSDEQTQTKDKESFPTEEAALTHFIENESPRDDIERVQTSQGSELFIVRSGNHQYSVYDRANENDEHSVEKLTATLSP